VRRLRRRPRHPLPPAPRVDLEGRRAEIELYDAAFADELWRRPAPL